jgi:hypothetical protein
MPTSQGALLHFARRRVYSKEYMLLLDVSALQWPELHLDFSTLQLLLLHLNVSRLHGPLLLLNVSTLQRHVMHLYTTQGLSTEACAAPERVYSTEDLSGQQDPTVPLLDVPTL